MKHILSLILVACLFLAPVSALLMPHEKILVAERRPITAFPGLPEKIRTGTIRSYFRQLGFFFSDRFPLRGQVIFAVSHLYEGASDNMQMTEVFRGRENWLFLGNNHARTVDKLRGVLVLEGKAFSEGIEFYRSVVRKATGKGSDFVFLIGPNKSSVYPEYLPEIVIPAANRYIDPLVAALRQDGVKICDPTQVLLGAKDHRLLYYRHDSHWNNLGAGIACENLLELLHMPKLPPYRLEPSANSASDLIGLGGFFDVQPSVEDGFDLHWQDTSAQLKLVSRDGGECRIDNQPRDFYKQGQTVLNPGAVSQKTAWVFGDSFSVAASPYMNAAFTKVKYFEHKNFEEQISNDQPAPDVIIWLIVERNFL